MKKTFVIGLASFGGIALIAIGCSHYTWSFYESSFKKHIAALTAPSSNFSRSQATAKINAAEAFLNSKWKEHASEMQVTQIIARKDEAQAFIAKQDAEIAARKAAADAEAKRKAEVAEWGPFFADFDNRQQAKKMCNDYAFRMTGQTRSWFYDDRTDFEISPQGERIWVGGPITVKVKDGNVDGSTLEYQRSVDCYWSRDAKSLEGGQISVN